MARYTRKSTPKESSQPVIQPPEDFDIGLEPGYLPGKGDGDGISLVQEAREPPLDSAPPIPALNDLPYASSESQLGASVEEHRAQGPNKGGRPRKDQMPPGITMEKERFIPRPKYTVFKSDASNPYQRTKAFLTYWNTLPAYAKDRLTLYVYRDFPILLPVAEDSGEYAYIDKIIGGEPLQDEMDLLHRYGCGSYCLRLNEKETIARCYVVGLGSSEFRSNPPTDRRIDDLEKNLDLNHPANSSYIGFLRSQGKLPDQQGGKRDKEEMATIEVVKTALDQNRDLMHTVVDMAREGNKHNSQPLEGLVEGITKSMIDGAQQANKLVADASMQSYRMLTEAAQLRDKRSYGEFSSMDSLKLALEIVDKIAGANKDNGTNADTELLRKEAADLRNQIMQMQQNRMESLEKMLTELRTAPSNSPFTSIKDGVAAIRQMKEVIDDIGGGGNDNPASDAMVDAAGDLAPKWLRPLLPVIGQVATAFMQYRMGWQPGPGQAMPPPQGLPMQPGMGGMAIPPPGIPGPQFQAQPQPQFQQPQGQPQGPPINLPPQVIQLLGMIQIPIIRSIRTSTGTEFADFFAAGFGDDEFAAVKAMGEKNIIDALYLFPPISQQLQMVDRARVETFVREFCAVNFDAQEQGQVVEMPS